MRLIILGLLSAAFLNAAVVTYVIDFGPGPNVPIGQVTGSNGGVVSSDISFMGVNFVFSQNVVRNGPAVQCGMFASSERVLLQTEDQTVNTCGNNWTYSWQFATGTVDAPDCPPNSGCHEFRLLASIAPITGYAFALTVDPIFANVSNRSGPLALTAVPEPGTFAIVALFGLALWLSGWSRRRRTGR